MKENHDDANWRKDTSIKIRNKKSHYHHQGIHPLALIEPWEKTDTGGSIGGNKLFRSEPLPE